MHCNAAAQRLNTEHQPAFRPQPYTAPTYTSPTLQEIEADESNKPICKYTADGTFCNAAGRRVNEEARKRDASAEADDGTSGPALTRLQGNLRPPEILLRDSGGTLLVPVSINNRLTLDFVIDSGAADVSIPADVVLTLIRTGTVHGSDFVGSANYELADGSIIPSQVFLIRELDVGRYRLKNVRANVAPVQATLLLGQSFLRRFGSWSIDNERHLLRLN